MCTGSYGTEELRTCPRNGVAVEQGDEAVARLEPERGIMVGLFRGRVVIESGTRRSRASHLLRGVRGTGVPDVEEMGLT
jgi:hypothetical protein